MVVTNMSSLGLSNAISIVFVLTQLSKIIEVKLKSFKNGSFYKLELGLLTLPSNVSESYSSIKNNQYGI